MRLLDAAIAAAGLNPQDQYREASDAIIDGRVSVNGAIFTDPDFDVPPGALVRYSDSDWSCVYIVPIPDNAIRNTQYGS